MEKKERDDTKKRILKTAIRLFAEYGYAGTSTRMIATEAGVNLSAISFHYNGKEGLYQETLRYLGERVGDYYNSMYEKVNRDFDEHTMTKEKAFAYIEEIIDLQLQAAFSRNNRYTVHMVWQEDRGPEGDQPLANILFTEVESVMAQLLKFLAPGLNLEEAFIISRHVNGSIISFGEHQHLVSPFISKKTGSETVREWIPKMIKNDCLMIVHGVVEGASYVGSDDRIEIR